MKRRSILAGFVLGGAVVRVLAGCMIDLDPPLPVARDSGAAVAVVEPVDAGADAGALVECATASDCNAGSFGAGCLTPRCAAGRCAFDLCATGNVCQTATCNLDAGACDAPTAVAFSAGDFAISTSVPFANLPCGTLGRCVAAGYPFLFVVDGQDSVSGYVVADPNAGLPRRVGVDRLGFTPAAILANENRIYFIGAPSGPLQDLRLRIGWLDVPANPFAASIPVTSVEVVYRASTDAVPQVFAAPSGELYVVSGRETFRFQPGVSSSASLVRPLPDNAALSVVASGGDRLVGASLDGAGNATFALLVNAGTLTAGFGGAATGAQLGPAAQLAVATGPDSQVVALAATGPVVDGGIPTATKARLEWIVEPNGGDALTADAGVELATYASVPTTNRLVGPVSIVSGGAFTMRANPALTMTVAELVARNDGGMPAVVANRNAMLPGSPGNFVLLTSQDWVYALSASTATLEVNVFRPGCDR